MADYLDNSWPVEWNDSEIQNNSVQVDCGDGFILVKISDYVATLEQISTAQITASSGGISASFEPVGSVPFDTGHMAYYTGEFGGSTYEQYVVSVTTAGASTDLVGMEFPETGIYVMSYGGADVAFAVSVSEPNYLDSLPFDFKIPSDIKNNPVLNPLSSTDEGYSCKLIKVSELTPSLSQFEGMVYLCSGYDSDGEEMISAGVGSIVAATDTSVAYASFSNRMYVFVFEAAGTYSCNLLGTSYTITISSPGTYVMPFLFCVSTAVEGRYVICSPEDDISVSITQTTDGSTGVINSIKYTVSSQGVFTAEPGPYGNVAAQYENETSSSDQPFHYSIYASDFKFSKIIIKEGVTVISNWAFDKNGSSKEVVLPDSLAFIGRDAFKTISTEEFTLPRNLVRSGQRAFSYGKVTTLYSRRALPPGDEYGDSLETLSSNDAVIYVPIGAGDAYKAAAYWSNHADIITETDFNFPTAWFRKGTYNSIVLPAPPVYDASILPYACIYKGPNYYVLWLTSKPEYYEVSDGSTGSQTGIFQPSGTVGHYYYLPLGGSEDKWLYYGPTTQTYHRVDSTPMVWSNYDICYKNSTTVYFAGSEAVIEPAKLELSLSDIDHSSVTVNMTCNDLLYTDVVYQVYLWLYKPGEKYWESSIQFQTEVFGGYTHSEKYTFTGLQPNTDYAVYGVIWLENEGEASDHNATATFTTLEGESSEDSDLGSVAMEVNYKVLEYNTCAIGIQVTGLPDGVWYRLVASPGEGSTDNVGLLHGPEDGTSFYFGDLAAYTTYTNTFTLYYCDQSTFEIGESTGISLTDTFTTGSLPGTKKNKQKSFLAGLSFGLMGGA